MTGYWKNIVLNGFKTGPHRTSINAINEYESFYNNHETIETLEKVKYKTTTSSKHLFVNPIHVKNMEYTEKENKENKEPFIVKFNKQTEVKEYYNAVLKERLKGRGPNNIKPNEFGYYEATIRSNKKIYSCHEVEFERKQGLTKNNFRYYPCYQDITDKNTLEWWFIHY